MLREPLVRGGGHQQREDSIGRLADRATIPELCLFSCNRRKSFSSANVNSKLYGQQPCSDLEVLYLDDHCRKEAVLKKSFLSSTAVLAFVSASLTAFAADLPGGAPAMVPVAFYDWTDCYIGAHIGGAFSGDTSINRLGISRSHNSSAVVGGGQIGCDFQVAPGWVLGAEGRGAGTSLKASNASTVTNLKTGVTRPSQFSVGNDSLASTTARLGYSFIDRWLFYVRGGAAWTNEKVDDAYTTVLGKAVDPSASTTRTGWTTGTGVEWAFARNWSVALDYDYCDFGSKGLTLIGQNVTVTVASFKDTIHAVTAGVNYRF
jgi:outer membrane immunogenic protein